jgi:hypothetical protein
VRISLRLVLEAVAGLDAAGGASLGLVAWDLYVEPESSSWRRDFCFAAATPLPEPAVMVDVPFDEVDDDEEMPEPARARRLRAAAATTSTTTTRSAGFRGTPALRETTVPDSHFHLLLARIRGRCKP